MVVVQMPDVSAKVKPNGEISLDFLMPNGILIPMSVDFYCSTFEKIKQVSYLPTWKCGENAIERFIDGNQDNNGHYYGILLGTGNCFFSFSFVL